MIITVNKTPYQIIEKLGAGGFGTVYLAENTIDQTQIVLKIIKVKVEQSTLIKNEIALLQWISTTLQEKSPFSRLYDSEYSESEGFFEAKLAMEWIDGPDLQKYRTTVMAKMSLHQLQETAGTIVLQILQALQLLHQLQTVHRDIKLENVLLRNPEHGQINVVLIDFGLSCSLHPEFIKSNTNLQTFIQSCLNRRQGTLGYAAPQLFDSTEILDFPKVVKTDIWSVGVLLFNLLYGQKPFPGYNKQQLKTNIKQYQNPNSFYLEILEKYPTPYNHIIKNIFNQSNKRPEIKTLINDIKNVLEIDKNPERKSRINKRFDEIVKSLY